jgi:hypothetical protein
MRMEVAQCIKVGAQVNRIPHAIHAFQKSLTTKQNDFHNV